MTNKHKRITATEVEPIPDQPTRFPKSKARAIAFLVHDRLHLTFSQMVNGLIKGDHDRLRAVANRNIIDRNKLARIHNKKASSHQQVPVLTPYDAETFRDRYNFEVDFALSAKR